MSGDDSDGQTAPPRRFTRPQPMTEPSDQPTRRKRRIWPPLVITVLIVLLVPDLRHTVGTWLAHILAVLAGLSITAVVLLGSGKHQPRR